MLWVGLVGRSDRGTDRTWVSAVRNPWNSRAWVARQRRAYRRRNARRVPLGRSWVEMTRQRGQTKCGAMRGGG